MKKYNVFFHPKFGLQAAKIGFSWPAFFLVFCWAFVKLLWKQAFWILGIFLFINLLAFEIAIRPEDKYGFILIILLAYGGWGVSIFVGFKGNEWLMANLTKRGFELLESIEAETPEAAITAIDKKRKISEKIFVLVQRSKVEIISGSILIVIGCLLFVFMSTAWLEHFITAVKNLARNGLINGFGAFLFEVLKSPGILLALSTAMIFYGIRFASKKEILMDNK